MSRNTKVPSYRRHRASGQAVVTLSGVDHYLGPYGTEVSKTEYDRVVGEWIVRGRRAADRTDSGDPLVKELLLSYFRHCEATMPVAEVEKVKQALRPVREMYGETPVREFDAIPFEALRQKLVKSGLAISTIRDRMGTVRRMVQWGVSRRMAPADALASIKAVGPLRARRDGVKPSRKVRPAPVEDIEAILPRVSPTIRAMVELQRHSGMRPGEVWSMTTGQVDRSGDVWIYAPTSHKTVDLGRDRKIPLGSRCQEILKPWLKADPDAILFSPLEAVERLRQEQRQSRKTPVYPSSRKRRVQKPKRVPRERYDKNSYAQAIARGCVRAGVPVFTPNQIRHTFATIVRRDFSVEHAQVMLGHAKLNVTQRYAETSALLAAEVARKIG